MTSVHSDVESRWYLSSPNERGTGAEMRPAMVSGIVSRDAPVNCWPKLKGDLHDDVFWLLQLEYRILQGFAFLCKLGLLLCKPLQDYQTKYERKNEMDSASSSKMTSSHARLAFLCNIILNIPEIFLILMILPLVWRYQICIASFLYSYRDDLTENLE